MQQSVRASMQLSTHQLPSKACSPCANPTTLQGVVPVCSPASPTQTGSTWSPGCHGRGCWSGPQTLLMRQCVSACMSVHGCVHTCMCVRVHTCNVCVHIFIHGHTHAFVFVCTCVCVHACMCVCAWSKSLPVLCQD